MNKDRFHSTRDYPRILDSRKRSTHQGEKRPTRRQTMRWYAQISRAEKRALWSCFAGWGLDGVDTQLFSLVIPTLLATWGIGKGEAGLIGGATLVAGALGGLLARSEEHTSELQSHV